MVQKILYTEIKKSIMVDAFLGLTKKLILTPKITHYTHVQYNRLIKTFTVCPSNAKTLLAKIKHVSPQHHTNCDYSRKGMY